MYHKQFGASLYRDRGSSPLTPTAEHPRQTGRQHKHIPKRHLIQRCQPHSTCCYACKHGCSSGLCNRKQRSLSSPQPTVVNRCLFIRLHSSTHAQHTAVSHDVDTELLDALNKVQCPHSVICRTSQCVYAITSVMHQVQSSPCMVSKCVSIRHVCSEAVSYEQSAYAQEMDAHINRKPYVTAIAFTFA